MNPDGISYLNISDYYREGDFGAATNAYWSPLFPWFLAQMLRLFDPSIYWEAPIAHLAIFVTYLISFAAFRYLLRQARPEPHTGAHALTGASGPSYAEGLAYATFLYSSLVLIGLTVVTPDHLVAAIAYGIGGLLAGAMRPQGKLIRYAMIGTLAGVGYLAKSPMFPAGLLAIAISFAISLRSSPHRMAGPAIAVACFALLSAPQMAAVSRVAGHLTFADTGRLSYGMIVNNYGFLWPENPPVGSGTPVNRVRTLENDPPVFQFSRVKKHSSFPLWDDPAYWNAGMKLVLSPGLQMRATKEVLKVYWLAGWPLIVAVAGCLIISRTPPRRDGWPLVALGGGMLVLYSLVHAEPRFIAPWMILLFLGINQFVASSRRGQQVAIARLRLAVCGILLFMVGRQATRDLRGAYGNRAGTWHPSVDIATWLRARDVADHGAVAILGNPFNTYWARLARTQIVVHMPEEDVKRYWEAGPERRAEINERMRGAGVGTVIASHVDTSASAEGWEKIGDTGLYARALIAKQGKLLESSPFSVLPDGAD